MNRHENSGRGPGVVVTEAKSSCQHHYSAILLVLVNGRSEQLY